MTTSRGDRERPCDLLDRGAVHRLLDTAAPDVVIHAAALTDVDLCERDPELARAANVSAVEHLVSAVPPGTHLVYVSTDQVYPDTPGPHGEEGTGPVNVYGATKLAGEGAALGHGRALVVRVNFFGHSRTLGRSSLSDFVIESLGARRHITLFSDVRFNPLHAADLAATIAELVTRGATGVLNVGSSTTMTKEEFGRAVAAHMSLDDSTASSGRSEAVPGRARRPLDLSMRITRAEEVLGRSLPTLSEEIALL